MEKDQKIIKHKKRNKIRLHYEGNKTLILGGIFIAAIIAIAFWLIGCNWITWSITAVLLAVYLIVVNFFRCPIRYFQQDTENVIVAPADGKVVVVEEVEETEYFKDKRMMVSIFMSLFNVHANWIPCDGIVKKVEHQDGNFKKAYLPKASTENERSTVIIETPEGEEIMARQIAGAMARRIVTYAEEGQECFVDDHLGFIKFGSRVDVFLPLGSEVCVKLGQKTVGNETVIAKLK